MEGGENGEGDRWDENWTAPEEGQRHLLFFYTKIQLIISFPFFSFFFFFFYFCVLRFHLVHFTYLPVL